MPGDPKYPIAVAMIAALVVCTAAGMWNGMLVSRIGMQPIIATLILFVAGRGIAMVTTNAMIIWLYAKPFALLGQGYMAGPALLHLHRRGILLLLTALVTRRTALGLFIEAVGINPDRGALRRHQRQEHPLLGLRLQRALRGDLRARRVLDGHERRREQRRQPVTSWTPSSRSCWAAPR